jgi:hypothetical protein
MVSESIDRRFKKFSRHFKPLLFLLNTFGPGRLACMAGYKRIYPSLCNAFPESFCALMQKFRPVHRPVICRFVREPLDQFLFTVSREFTMTSTRRWIIISSQLGARHYRVTNFETPPNNPG